MQIERGLADVNGTKLYYEAAGAGPALLLLHGFSLDMRMWDDQVAALAPRRRVIRYDMRGFGRSAAPSAEPFSHAADLRALLDFLGVEAAAVAGLSMGGAVALDFALSSPRRASALILIGGQLEGVPWSPELLAPMKAARQAARAGDMDGARALWLAHPFFAPALGLPAAAPRLRQMVAGYSGWHFATRSPEQSSAPPAAERLEQVAAPTLVIAGEADVPEFRAMAEQLARRIPHARLATIAGAGHLAPMEAPGPVNEAIAGFLDALR
jgi:3-oxoadipate enol-lactonase